ncbi:MAG: DDE-type integrase/transposase/recombinase [Clostridia bacterium]|nr:DDE-type integrase/transposase/recombinase [Clostridia bacterium]MDD4375352.1 DDE-type integrase/transposase/recombinase [Clostridia bacterium]
MNSITQKVKYKQSVVKFSYKYGVKRTAIKFNECERTIYRWRKRYDGTLESLVDKSRKPHYHPNQHTIEEIKLIKKYKANSKKTGLVIFWVKLRRAGYTRTIQGLYHVMRNLGIYEKAPSKKKTYEPIEWEEIKYPGQKVQIDVKYVPRVCMTKELIDKKERYYQYTAIDEYTRKRCLWFTNEHSTYESAEFVKKIVKKFPFKIECIQTDNGFEFTNRLSWNAFLKGKKTLFESVLEDLGIKHKLIKPHTPKQNGKVERSHRKDQERFYYEKVFNNLEDLRDRAKYWINEYNNFPMSPLKWLSPNEKLEEYNRLQLAHNI